MAEGVENLGYCQTSTLDSEMTDGGWCDLSLLIVSRNKLRTEMRDTETRALTLDQEICENRVSEGKSLCGSCGLVMEPRQRKIAALRLMHQVILTSKPGHLLCTAGIITRLESMILAGFLDCGSTNKVTRCRECRQDTNEDVMKSYILSEFIDILEEQCNKCTNKEDCSMNEACCACLKFMLSRLRNLYLFITPDDDMDDPNLADDNHHSDAPASEPKDSPQNDTQHSNEHNDKTPQNDDQDGTKNLNIDSELKDESTPISDQDNFVTESEKATPVIDQHSCPQHFNFAANETTSIFDQDGTKHSTCATDRDVPNDLTEIKSPDCELHSHIDPATKILFKDLTTKQLQSLTAELDKLYVEQINQQENQKDLVTQITLLKVKLQDRVKSETMHTELEKIQKEIVSQMNQLKDQFVTSEFTVHSELKMQQNSHEKLACKMDQLKWDLAERVTPEKLKSELEIHRKRHDKLIAKIDGLEEKLQGYVQTEEIQATLDKQTNIQNNLIAQWNNFCTKHGKEKCVTIETLQTELTKHTKSVNDLLGQRNNCFTKRCKEFVTFKTMLQESSKQEKILNDHLHKLNAIQDQLTRLESNHKKLQAEFSDQKYNQSKKVLDLQVDVGNLKRKQENYGLASGPVIGLNLHGQNQASAVPNSYRCPEPYPRPFYTPFH